MNARPWRPRRHQLLMVPIAVGTILALGSTAVAGDGFGGIEDEDVGQVDSDGETSLRLLLDEGGGTDGAGQVPGLPEGYIYIRYPHLERYGDSDDDNNGWCRGERWDLVPRREANDRRQHMEDGYDYVIDNELGAHNAIDRDSPCPAGDDAIDGQDVRHQIEEYVTGQLPRPEPHIEPGYALTGMPAYLETGRHRQATFTTDLSTGPLATIVSIDAQLANVEVDWGNGHVETYANRHEGPYPHGEIRHAYADIPETGQATITVTDTWRVTFEVPGIYTDTIEVTLDPRSNDFDVRELRTVRTHESRPHP